MDIPVTPGRSNGGTQKRFTIKQDIRYPRPPRMMLHAIGQEIILTFVYTAMTMDRDDN